MSYDPYDPAVDPETEAFLNYILGGQSQIFPGTSAPYLDPGQFQMLSGMVPGMPGEDEQLDFNKSAVNYIQDLAQLSMDPFYAGLAGAGAFAPGTLEPTVSTTVVDRPNYRRVAALAAGDPDSYEGKIAQALLDGYPGSSALRDIYAELDQYEPESDEWLTAVRRLNLPTTIDQGATVLDEMALRNTATGLEASLFDDPQPGTSEAVYDERTGELISSGGERYLEQDPETGEMVLMERTVEESPLAEHYREAGLPLPTDEFTPGYILGPEWQQQAAGYDAAGTAEREAMTNYLAAAQAERDYTPGRAATRQPAVGATAGQQEQLPPMVEGSGVPWNAAAAGTRDVSGIAVPVGQPPGGYWEDALAMGPEEFGRWWAENRDTMGDEERMNQIIRVNQLAQGNNPEAVGWGQVYDQISSDFREASPEPIGGEIATAVADRELPGLTESQQVSEQATAITSPEEMRDFVVAHPEITDYTSLAGIAMNNTQSDPNNAGEWSQVANDLLSGDLTAVAVGSNVPAGVAGQSFMAPGTADAIRARVQDYLQQGQPPPPPGPLSGPPAPGQTQPGPFPPTPYTTDEDARAQAQRVAMERALLQMGGSPSDLPWSTFDQPPPSTSEWQAAPDRGVDLGRGLSAPDQLMHQAMLDSMVWQAAGQAQPQSNYPPISAVVAAVGGGTGPITAANYGGGPRPTGGTQVGEYLSSLAARGGAGALGQRRGVRTGEERTEAQRREQARRNAPHGESEDYDVLSSGYGGSGRRRRVNQARQAWHDSWLDYQQQRLATYGAEEGYARAVARNMADQGITPYMMTVAARQQVPMAAGINTPGRAY